MNLWGSTKLFAIMLVGLWGFAFASPISFEQALELAAPRSTQLASARAALEEARAERQEAELDPTTLIMHRTQTEHAVILEEARWNQAQHSFRLDLLSDIHALLDAEEAYLEASLSYDLAERELNATRARFATGNATELDVSRAESRVATERLTLAQTESELELARGVLSAQLGAPPEGPWQPQHHSPTRVLPDFQGLLEKAHARHPELISARQGLVVAELRVTLADNDYTPRSELRAAENSLSQAEVALRNAEQAVLIDLERRFLEAKAAYDTLPNLETNVNLAQESYRIDQRRLEAGTITGIDLLASELSRNEAEHAFWRGERRFLEATLALDLGVNVPLEEALIEGSAP